MNIRIENDRGFSVTAGGASELKLLDYPDFGCPQATVNARIIPGRDGELFSSSHIGARDIFLKLESGLPLCITARVLAPGNDVTVYVDDKWSIKGHITGIKEHRRPARLAKPVITLGIRCCNPFFTSVNGRVEMSFDNNGGGIYEGGDYTCTQLTLFNSGDIPCPVSVTMCSNATTDSTPSGLFNHLDWNDGAPIYTGLVFKKGTEAGITHFITTDTSSERFFESYAFMDNCDYFLLPPGETRLYAQNVSGRLEFSPQYIYVDGREL